MDRIRANAAGAEDEECEAAYLACVGVCALSKYMDVDLCRSCILTDDLEDCAACGLSFAEIDATCVDCVLDPSWDTCEVCAINTIFGEATACELCMDDFPSFDSWDCFKCALEFAVDKATKGISRFPYAALMICALECSDEFCVPEIHFCTCRSGTSLGGYANESVNYCLAGVGYEFVCRGCTRFELVGIQDCTENAPSMRGCDHETGQCKPCDQMPECQVVTSCDTMLQHIREYWDPDDDAGYRCALDDRCGCMKPDIYTCLDDVDGDGSPETHEDHCISEYEYVRYDCVPTSSCTEDDARLCVAGSPGDCRSFDPSMRCRRKGECCADADGDGWTTCENDCDDNDSARFPGNIETCNGVDNDCDGAVDESQGQVVTDGPCVGFQSPGGGPTTQHILCEEGTRFCTNATFQCRNARFGDVLSAPQPETCDYIDNDCDGAIDEEWPELFRQCNCAAPCGILPAVGLAFCKPDGTGTECRCETVPISENDPGRGCNGIDDDCDGVVDNGVPKCQCSPALGGVPGPEICDDIDNDCDGVVDGMVDTCIAGVGACELGERTCTAGTWGACTSLVSPGPIEDTVSLCNGIDDDCDGIVDGVGTTIETITTFKDATSAKEFTFDSVVVCPPFCLFPPCPCGPNTKRPNVLVRKDLEVLSAQIDMTGFEHTAAQNQEIGEGGSVCWADYPVT